MKYTTIYNDPWTRAKITFPWVYWDNGFTEEEIQKIVDYCEEQGTEFGSTFGSKTEEDTKRHRVSNVKFHNRNENTAWIFDRLNGIIQSINEQFYGYELNGYGSFQYTTYDAETEGRYDWHTDMEFTTGHSIDIEPRKLSMTLLLNDDFEGGEFQINIGKEENMITVPSIKGRAIFFPSFMIHRVKPITKGTRRSLVVWVLGPKFV
jgi:PKHD-type hydroxylase